MASLNIINNASSDDFVFKRVIGNDIILAVSHFRSQAAGKDGILQNIIAKTLPTIVTYLTKFFNASILKVIFP